MDGALLGATALGSPQPWGELDVSALGEAGCIDALASLQALRSWVDAQEARVFARVDVLAEREPAGKQWVRDEVGAALRLSPGWVCARMHEGRELVDRLPETLRELACGTITERHARGLVDAVGPLDDVTVAAVEKRVLERAGDQTPGAFAASVRRAVARLDPRGAEERHQHCRDERRVSAREVGDGMSEVWALLPTEGAAELWTALQAVAGILAEGDERTVDQRRADALVALAAGRLDDPSLPTWHGRRPAVNVTVALSTLLGCDDLPGDVEGFGPITAAAARAVAFDPTGTWRRIVADNGRMVEASRTYEPPVPLAEHVIARDHVCRFPGCTRPGRRCEIDHRIPWPRGQTDAANLECLCPRHHHLKHEAGWQVCGEPDGTIVWTSPTGRVYRAPPFDWYD